jgi:hypothetical protein
VFSFQLFELDHQLVELRVGNLGVIEDVVQVLVVSYLVAQLLDLLGQRSHREDYIHRACRSSPRSFKLCHSEERQRRGICFPPAAPMLQA